MYLTVKLIHIISSTLLFGTGLGTAFFMVMAYRSGNMLVMAETNRIAVIADYVFTTPTIFIQLGTGLMLLEYRGISWTSTWSISVLGLYAFIGICWIPVVFLQISLRDLARSIELPNKQYKTQMKVWLTLGILAFPAVIVLFGFMVFKPFWS